MSVLASLVRAYDRLPKKPAFGYAVQDTHFFIVLDTDGQVVGKPEPWGFDEKGRLIARAMTVPYFGGRSGSAAPPYFLWDNSAYVLGVSAKENFDPLRRFEAFQELHFGALAETTEPGLAALREFLRNWSPADFERLGFPQEVKDRNIVFRFRSEEMLVHESAEAKRIWRDIYVPDTVGEAVCLITGEREKIARLHPPIKSFENPARIVSFDKDNDAFSSYGHVQAENAPTGIVSAFAYTAVLNSFLAKDSGHRIQIGDASTVFWADCEDMKVAEEADLWGAVMLGNRATSGPEEQAVERNIERRLLLIRDGKPLRQIAPDLAEGVRFHVLGLAPNAARLVVRFYWEDDFGTLADHYAAYLRDVAIEPAPERPIFSIVAATLRTAPARRDAKRRVTYDRDATSPLLSGELLRAILTGGRFPRGLLALLVMRVRGDHVLDRIRLALIKGLIVRDMRLEGRLPKHPDGTDMEDYLMRSDPDDPCPARRLGRLFALIERAQLAALGDEINATVKDKYLGAAAATPGRVFPKLIENAETHHLKRLRNGHSDAGWIKNSEHARRVAAAIGRDIGLLWGETETGAPAQHDSEEQGLFFVGYYQERYGKRRAGDTDGPQDDAPETGDEE